MRLLLIFLLLTFIGPFLLLLTGRVDFHSDWRTANRQSAGIAPNPITTSDAIIQVYSARAFNWRGLFSVHTWIAVKPQNAKQYIVYQLIGWRLFRNLSPLVAEADIPDRYWFNQKPNLILEIHGQKAEKIIPQIMLASKNYPYPNSYRYWPGPNSNTFIAHIARQVPEMRLALPSNAIGKDYLTNPHYAFFARAPSGTGYQFSFYGIFGVMLAAKEGLEINILGLVYGISPLTLSIKLPGLGDQSIQSSEFRVR